MNQMRQMAPQRGRMAPRQQHGPHIPLQQQQQGRQVRQRNQLHPRREKDLLKEVESLKKSLEEKIRMIEKEKRRNDQLQVKFKRNVHEAGEEKRRNEKQLVSEKKLMEEREGMLKKKVEKEIRKNEQQNRLIKKQANEILLRKSEMTKVTDQFKNRANKMKKEIIENKRTIEKLEGKSEKNRKNEQLEKQKNEQLSDQIEKLTSQTRLDRKIQEITDEEFWSYNPTKYASLNTGKLEFHHNIFKFPKFICRFMKERSKYENEESYEEMRLACRYFENVFVCLSEDRILKKFVDDTKTKYLLNIRREMTKKDSRVSSELKILIQNLILDVYRFFYPPEFDGKPKPGIGEIRKFIKESQDLRGGNQLFLGDLHHKFGVCRHHSTLFKLVCDSLGILCKLECIEEFHAWNLIQLKEDFFFVDLTNFGNRLFGVSEYYEMLESNLENLGVNKVQKRLIRKLVTTKRVERGQIKKLEEYVRNPVQFVDECLQIKTQKGGFGDVLLLQIRKNVQMLRPSNERLFEKGEVIAVKKILVKNEEEDVLSSGKNTDGIPRRYAIREASHMKILDHSSIIRVIGYWESRDEKNVPHVYIAMNGMDEDGRGFLRTLKNKPVEEMNKIQKLTEVIYFLIETARGLRYLSTLKIVHLDLKLENVMIQWDNENNQIFNVRIIDFGGAKNNDIQTSNFMTTEGYDAPEIIDIKTMKSIRDNIQKIKIEVSNARMNRRTIENLVNNCTLNFFKLSQTIHVKELEEEFIFLCKICEDMNFRFRTKEELEKKILSQKYVEEVSSSSSSSGNKVVLFDCRADIYSFGVMMDEFLREGLLPQELRYFQEKCVEFDRRDRPSIDEIIYVLKQRLSFFNEKMKE